ncbi:hypothetical protein VKT23_019174 [Stygiomarasmius scandens]|uniref:Uncharacterized protein n=1 Tax=Marasmiellus scandens TaxID=2682957 RepID=A0ABR1ILZ6_9AGAR
MPSAYDYTPNSYSSTLFNTRAQPNGLYHYVTNLITEMGPLAFANTTAGIDYVRSAQPGDRSYGFVGKDSRTFTTNIFGEILGSKYGTFTTAWYNHYPGGDKQNPTPLGDRSKPAKAVFALGCPTQAPDVLADIWYNQLVSANDLHKYEAVWEGEISQAMAANGEQAPSFSVKEFVKNICHPDDPRVEPDCIILTGPGMYMVRSSLLLSLL